MASAEPLVPVLLRFERMPKLRNSYPRVLAQRKPSLVRAGASVPRFEVRLAGHRADPDKLAEYRALCGFAAGAVLPQTFVHVLAMPLHMELLAHPRFPIGVFGLVHVRNRIDAFRPIAAEETLDLQSVLEGHRESERGQEFELFTHARVGDELVWSECCTFLARRRGGEGRPAERGARTAIAELESATLTSWAAPADIGRRYAAVSGDYNPIHLSALTAKAFGFPRAIAHGMWSAARIAAELGADWPTGRTRFEIAFRAPVLLPAHVLLQWRAADDGVRFQLRDDAGERLHLTGSVGALD